MRRRSAGQGTGQALVVAFLLVVPAAWAFGDAFDRQAGLSGGMGLEASPYESYVVAKGEGHTHTNHSSGVSTVAQNVATAKTRGLNWLAITDHKTVSPRAECEAETSVDFICVLGEEVSTSGGHVLAWGIDGYVDWALGPGYDMDDVFESIIGQGGLSVLAHPFAPDPDDYDYFGTYEGFDALEIYHGYAGFNDDPISTDMDGMALAKWEEYLNAGWRKVAVGDSDSHDAANTPDMGDVFNRRGAIGYPRNVVYADELSLDGIKEALIAGRSYLTDGPALNFTVDDRVMGDTIYSDIPKTLTINITGTATATSDLNVLRNGTVIFNQNLAVGAFSHSFQYLASDDSWFRAEIRKPAFINGEFNVAFTNPIYFDLLPYEEPPAPPTNLTISLVGTDVALSWNASTSSDIDYYAIFRSATVNGFDFKRPIARSRNTSWTDSGKGIGNGSTLFYTIRSVDRTRLNDSNTDKVAKLVIPLEPGMRLVSIPVEPSNASLDSVLQTLDFESVWQYNGSNPTDPWASRVASRPFNELDGTARIDHRTGFWVDVGTQGNITVAGRVPKTTDIQLRAGWNLAGYPSFTERTVSSALGGVTWERMEGFDPGGSSLLRLLYDADIMRPFEGYWIRIPADDVWTVPE